MTVTLKRSLGEAGAFIDESHGGNTDNLFQILKQLALTSGPSLAASVSSPTVSVIASAVLVTGLRLTRFSGRLGNTGSSGTTIVVLKISNVVIATLTWLSSEANGTFKEAIITDDDLKANELVEIEVTSIASGPLADLNVTALSQAVLVE